MMFFFLGTFVHILRISLPFITMDEEGSPLHLEEELTRAEFEGLCAKLLERLRDPVEKALKDADLSYKDLDEVVPPGSAQCLPACPLASLLCNLLSDPRLVGGSTRIGAVQELVRSLVGGKELNQSASW